MEYDSWLFGIHQSSNWGQYKITWIKRRTIKELHCTRRMVIRRMPKSSSHFWSLFLVWTNLFNEKTKANRSNNNFQIFSFLGGLKRGLMWCSPFPKVRISEAQSPSHTLNFRKKRQNQISQFNDSLYYLSGWNWTCIACSFRYVAVNFMSIFIWILYVCFCKFRQQRYR